MPLFWFGFAPKLLSHLSPTQPALDRSACPERIPALRKNLKNVAAFALACGLLLSLPGCGIPTLRKAQSAPALPQTFNGTISSESSAQLGLETFYGDPVLIDLILQAENGNRELKVLEQEVQIASNEILARRGAYLPEVSAGLGGGIEKTSRFTRNGAVEENLEILPGKPFPDPLANVRLGFDISWNLDIWHAYRKAQQAAVQRYYANIERRNGFVTQLVADIAENYYGLMALDKRMENLDQTISLQQQSYKFALANKEAARGTELAVQRFLAEVRRNQSEKLIVQQDIIEVENRINFLMNRYPVVVQRQSAGFFDLNLNALSIGVPSQLLRNRPDIRQAERELAAVGLDVQVARARFYPSLIISAGVGYESFDPKYLFNPQAFAANAMGGLVAPLINKKAIQADYMSANARQLQAVYNYQRLILEAYTEVVNRVSMAENYRQSVEIKKQQLQALQASVNAATSLFQKAKAEYSEVLFSQRDLRDARTALIDTKRQQLAAVVKAYQALGGGLLYGQPVFIEGQVIQNEEIPPGPPAENIAAPMPPLPDK